MTTPHSVISYQINIGKVQISTSTRNSFATDLLNLVAVIMPSHTTTLNTYKSKVGKLRWGAWGLLPQNPSVRRYIALYSLTDLYFQFL